MRIILIFGDQEIDGQKVPLSEIYNPGDIPIYRYPVDSPEGRAINAEKNEAVYVERVSGNTFKVIRRIRWPWDNESYYNLIAPPGQGGGNGQYSGVIIPIGAPKESYSFGAGGLGNMPTGKLILYIVAGFLVYNAITD